MATTLNYQNALIYLMVLTAAADGDVHDDELATIRGVAASLPILSDYGTDKIGMDADNCISLLEEEDGIETILALAKEALPKELYSTAYALMCDIVASDGFTDNQELALLQMACNALGLDSLSVGAIEYSARVRYKRAVKTSR